MSTIKVTNLKNESFVGDQLYLKSDGRLGIGTTTPDSNLDIEGSGSPELRITDTTNTVGAYIQSNDTKAIFGSRTNHPVQIEQNAGAALYIDTSKNVGIGTTSPSSIFQVRPLDETNFLVRNEGSTVVLASETNSGRDNNRGMALEATHFEFIEGGSDKLRIDSSGKVGIGTTSPSEQLHINSAATTNGLLISSTNNNTRAMMELNGKDSSGNQVELRLGGFGDTNRGEIYTVTNHDVGFATNNAAPQMVLKTSGNVGIGTLSPNGKLHISEVATETDGDINQNADGLIVDNSAGNTGLTFKTPNTASSRICFGDPEDNNVGQMLYNHSTDDLTITAADNIILDGKVGINESAPDRHLHVKSGSNSDDGVLRIESANNNIMDTGTDGTGHFLNCVSADPFRVKFAGSEKLRILSGGGITFNGDTAAANALDDYEEGTFTPTATVEGESAASTDKNYGRYVKTGKKVTVWCYVQLNGTPSNRASTKAWQHGGLPFTHVNVVSGFDVAGSMLHWTLDSNSSLTGTAPYTLVPRLFNNATGGRIRAIGSDANQTGTNASLLMKDNTEYSYTLTYETA